MNRYCQDRRPVRWPPGRHLGVLLLGWQLAGLTALAVPSPPGQVAFPSLGQTEHICRPSSVILADGDPVPHRAGVRDGAPRAVVPPTPLWWGIREGATALPLLGVAILILLVWVALLRRKVQGQAPVFREWLRREAMLSKQYRELFEVADNAILIYESDNEIILDANPKACELYGWTRQELVGASLRTLTKGVGRSEEQVCLVGEGKARTGPATLHYRKDGRPISILVDTSTVQYAGKTATLSINRDVTEQVEKIETLHRRGAILEAVSFAAEELLSGGDWEAGLQAVLERLGLAASVSRAYIFENHIGPEGDLISSLRNEWTAPGITPLIANPALQGFSWKARGLQRGVEDLEQGKIAQGTVNTVTEIERKFLDDHGVKSYILVPIFVDARWWGFIGFHDCLGERQWSSEEAEALRAAAKALGAALHRRQADETLRKANDLVKAVVQASPVAITAVDSGGAVRMWNAAAERLLGWSEEEVLGKALPHIPVEDEANYRSLLRRALRGEALTNVELRRKRKDGSWVDIQLSTAPLFDDHGQGAAALGVMNDITERKHAEQALKESESRYRRLVGAVTDYICSVDLADGGVIRTSHGPGCVAVTGYTPEEYPGSHALVSDGLRRRPSRGSSAR